jgi:hypothetical protein
MPKLKVYPLKKWDQMAGSHQEFRDRFATPEKIEKIGHEPIDDAGIEVDADRVFDGWYIEREYKGHLFHVLKGTSGFTIHIYGTDGSPASNTAPYDSALKAAQEARKIVDAD